MKTFNFSPGPSKLPDEVIHKASEAVKKYKPTNNSILEITHRSKEFEEIIEKTKESLKFQFSIPDDYKILLLQGGATFQNSLLAYNFPTNSNIGCLVIGTWGMKTYNDILKVLENVEKYEFNYSQLSSIFKKSFRDFDFLHVTSNETIEGIQIRNLLEIKNSNLIVDMSSDIGSHKFSFKNISYIYAGAQKNLGIPGVTLCIIKEDFLNQKNSNPAYLNLSELVRNNSLLNTPSTFSIYILNLVLEWMEEMGGISYFEKKSLHQSNLIYEFLENNKKYFEFLEKSEFRSRSNITFNFKKREMTDMFLDAALKKGIFGIKGYRSIGGVRISLYNSITDEMVNYLLKFTEKFVTKELK